MRSQTCYFCEKQIPAGIAICPHCGKRQYGLGERTRQNWSILVAVALSVIVFVGWHYLRGAH